MIFGIFCDNLYWWDFILETNSTLRIIIVLLKYALYIVFRQYGRIQIRSCFFLQKLESGSGFLTDDERDRENREREIRRKKKKREN